MTDNMKREYGTISIDGVELGECWWATTCDVCRVEGDVITFRVTLGYEEYNDIDVCPACLRKIADEVEVWAIERKAETE